MSLFPSILNDYLEVCQSGKRFVGVLVAVENKARHNAALQDIPFTHLSDVSEKNRCPESRELGGDPARTELLPGRRTGAEEEKLRLEKRKATITGNALASSLSFSFTCPGSPRKLASAAICTHCPSGGGGGPFCHLSLSVLRCSTRTVLFSLMAVILLFSFPPAQTFDYDALRRTFRNFKKHFSVRLLDPHIPRFFCLSAGPATAHQDHRFLPLLLRPSCSRLRPLC